MKRLLGLAVLLAALLPGVARADTNFSYDTTVTYRVDEGRVSVTEDYVVTNKTARIYLTELKISTPTNQVSNVKASYSDGGAIPAVVEPKRRPAAEGRGIAQDYQEITLRFPRTNYGSGRRWSFRLSFEAGGLLDAKGSAHTVFIPSVQEGASEDKYQAIVDVPAAFGAPHFAGAQAATGGVVGDRQRFTFTKAELVEHSLALAFGDATIYRTNFNFPLHNTSLLPRKLSVTLPPDLGNQRAYVESMQPRPRQTRVDADGNVLAEYLLQPGQRLSVRTDVVVVIRYLDYGLSASGLRRDIPTELVQQYTKSTRFWPTGGAIAKAAASVTDDREPTVNNVRAIYQYVIDKLSYNNDKIKFNIRQGAAQALARPENAVCLEYSDLMIAMLRSRGIPARMPVGYAYSEDLKSNRAVSESLHSWVEAYVPGIGWMALDPTWGEKFDQFGRSDLDHLAFAVWGLEDERPVATMASGRDLNYQYEAASLKFETQFQPTERSMQVSVTRYLLLPFVWLEQARVVAPAGETSDRNWLEVGHQRFNLGSLAPLQTVVQNRLSLESRGQVPARLTRENQPQVLAASVVQLNYLPFWCLLGATVLILLAWAGWRIWKHHRAELAEQTEQADPASIP